MWKKIDGANNYEVSDKGEVRSIDRYKKTWNGKTFCNVFYKGIILKQKDIRGYKNVCIIYDDGKKRTRQVHRLVMETFKPVSNKNEMQVNHVDGIKSNNNLNNLEWCTCRENILHSHKTGLIKSKRNQNGEKNNLSKLTNKDVIKIIQLIRYGYKNKVIAEMFGVKENTISNIRNYHTWKHIPR